MHFIDPFGFNLFDAIKTRFHVTIDSCNPDHYYRLRCKIAAFVYGICWLHFCTVGGCGDPLSIFIMVNGLKTFLSIGVHKCGVIKKNAALGDSRVGPFITTN